MRDGLTGALHHHVFQGADGTRYLRVFVLHGRSPSAVIETIAHELQHVVEFLESGSDDFAAFSSRRPDLLDRRADLTAYETAAAQRTTAVVRRELAACDRK